MLGSVLYTMHNIMIYESACPYDLPQVPAENGSLIHPVINVSGSDCKTLGCHKFSSELNLYDAT